MTAVVPSKRARYSATLRQLSSSSGSAPFQPASCARSSAIVGVVGRRERQPVLPEHLERHALVHLAGVVGMREQLHVGVRVHVDEARA